MRIWGKLGEIMKTRSRTSVLFQKSMCVMVSPQDYLVEFSKVKF